MQEENLPQFPTVSLDDARNAAIKAAYDIVDEHRHDSDRFTWNCPIVELVAIGAGANAIVVYRIEIELTKRRGWGPKGQWKFEFQVDPRSGRVVGMKDFGWRED